MTVMHKQIVRPAAIAATFLVGFLAGNAPMAAEELQITAAMQFDEISGLAGQWQVQEHASLRIVFEPTAGGSSIVESWMLGERTHSLTIYHLDGERMIATHYCPQGNQPRLAAGASLNGEMRFTLLDVTGLDPHESYQHDLSFKRNGDGTISRSETYYSPDGAAEENTLTLFLAKD